MPGGPDGRDESFADVSMNQLLTDFDVHRFIFQTSAKLKGASDPERVLRQYLRSTAEAMQADRACIAVLEAGHEAAEPLFAVPADATCDLSLVAALLRNEQPPIPRGTICARLTRRGRPWGILVLEKAAAGFPTGSPRALAHIADEVSDLVQRMDGNRLSEVRARIDGKIMRELPPKDLYYQILDGLHQLARYDHSAALWIWNPEEGVLELVAEQIAWRKQKSTMIGRTVTLGPGLQALLGNGVVYGFDRLHGAWTEWTPHGATALAELVDGSGAAPHDRRSENAMLCAALGARDGPLGMLTLAALAPETFRDHELAIVERFTLLASLALQRAQTVEQLQGRMLKIERHNALAHLARGVAHDINNALGEVLPLVQQMRADLADGPLEPATLAEDLHRIEHSLQVTRGIFGRMLRFARGSSRSVGPGDIGRAFETVRDVLAESLARREIAIRAQIDDGLPAVRCGQSDLERLFFNLIGNARDAMPGGGQLTIGARASGGHVELLIADDGIGMAPETLSEIERPFFSTKEHGTGLGLSTCRSIVAEGGGDLLIESRSGDGTRVTVHFPTVLAGDGGAVD